MSNVKNNGGRKPKEKHYDTVFAQRLRDLIFGETQKGITLNQIADALQITRQSLAQYRDGNNVPDVVILSRIADYFGVSTDYLAGRTDIKLLDVCLQTTCNYTQLSEAAVKNFEFLKHPDYNDQNSHIPLWELTNLFLSDIYENDNDDGETIGDSPFSLLMKMIQFYTEIALSDDGENAYKRQQELDFAKWRVSKHFEDCLDIFLAGLKGEDDNG